MTLQPSTLLLINAAATSAFGFPTSSFLKHEKDNTGIDQQQKDGKTDSSMKFSFAMLILLHSVAFRQYRSHPELF